MGIYMVFPICTGPITFLTPLVMVQTKKLRQPPNFILVSLAMAGLILVYFVFTVSIYSCLMAHFALGQMSCTIEGFTATLRGQVFLWSLVVLAIEKYIV
uniref:G-protein coupled receptors family 1 profile domain-containing protein n=1 Tax=Tetraodon nigroviridis TaxID=99883 RepID=H3BZD6_TETNG